jgi:uncharacterized protein
MSEKELYQTIADEQNLKLFQVTNTIELLDTGNTIPFIARYRKEATGKLNEDQIRSIAERTKYLRLLEERKKTVIKSIKGQGKLTKELEGKINSVVKLQELEDLYLPYKPKKRTRATVAKERGLTPLAETIMGQKVETGDPFGYAAEYINPQKEVKSAEEAIAGAIDIIAEIISENADIRRNIRDLIRHHGQFLSKAKKPEQKSEYELYYDFRVPVKKMVPHRILAINRGEKEDFLKVQIEIDESYPIDVANKKYIKNRKSIFTSHLEEAIKSSYKRLIKPSIEREIRSELTDKAEEHAIQVFGKNLKNLLLQPPTKGKIIMGIDPGFRTGCKVAIIDDTGKYLEGDTIYPHPPQNQIFESKTTLRRYTDRHQVEIIGIGNGTASRETELFIVELIHEIKEAEGKQLQYIIVNEAGASVYSASQIAKNEFPDLDVSMRGNISIARRLLDPLAEMVKIDPKSIGVGLYQHDVDQGLLEDTLNAVVESAVNLVGVDLNTASFSLLKFISGLNARTAANIIKYRNENGKFQDRKELKKISGVGENVFQQSAGFMRIVDGKNQLDSTSIHPESYKATKKLLERFNVFEKPAEWQTLKFQLQKQNLDVHRLAEEIDIGEPTLGDILDNLVKPGRDPRDELPKPVLRSDVLKLEDLHEGMILKGIVRNVVDFGAFVDIGIKRDGLVHVSEMADKFVKNPHKIVAVGDVISVKVTGIDLERERVRLSMKF